MERNKMMYWMKFRPAERLHEQETDALRKEAVEFRKRTEQEHKRHFVNRVWDWLLSLKATLQPSGEALVELSDQYESATYPAEPEYPAIDWKAPEQAGET